MARYRARPVEVEAFQITHVSHHLLGKHTIELEDCTSRVLEAGQVARMTPVVGDYLVRTSDGYESLNPKSVFEANYELVGTPAETSVSQLGLISAAKEKLVNSQAAASPEQLAAIAAGQLDVNAEEVSTEMPTAGGVTERGTADVGVENPETSSVEVSEETPLELPTKEIKKGRKAKA